MDPTGRELGERMGHTVSDAEHPLTDLDFRIEQEREQFSLYEQRRLGIELQATAITAAALTIAALLVAGEERLSKLGDVVEYGIAVAIAGLLVAIVFASFARFGSWRSPAWLGRPQPRQDHAVKDSLQALRAANQSTSAVELRRLALAHWNARSVSAWKLGEFKSRWLLRAVLALTLPVLFLLLVGVALLV